MKIKKLQASILLLSIFSFSGFASKSVPGDSKASDAKVAKSKGKTSPPTSASSGRFKISEVWTNWYRYPELFRVINLTAIRDRLSKNNLVSAYRELPRSLRGKQVTCNERAQSARTDDGSCNSLEQPAMGAVGMAFGRNVPVGSVVKSRKKNIMNPSPYQISKRLLKRDTFKPIPFLNFWVTNWLQFMNHDWFFHGKSARKNPYRLRTQNGSVMKIPRTRKPDHRLKSQAHPNLPKNKIFRNHVTHWWDGSQIYGSDSETVRVVRLYQGGKLKIDEKTGLLPLDPKGIEEVGLKDNWWVGLSLLHHLFVKEHNAIAEALAKEYPNFNDEKLYDTARLVNAAVMAKIHTVEWTPAVLPNKTLNWAMNTNWYGAINPEPLKALGKNMAGQSNLLLHEADIPPFLEVLRQKFGLTLTKLLADIPAKAKHTNTSLGNLGGALMTGMIGTETELFDVPYAITEEFVAVYRMHPLIPEELEVRSTQTDKIVKRVPIDETRHEKSMPLLQEHGMATLFYSFGRSHPGALTLRNYPAFMTNMKIPENPDRFNKKTLDLAALEIIRDRARGVPRYNEFRRLTGLKPIRKFEDLFVDENRPSTANNLKNSENQELLQELKKIYHNDVEQLDLLVGTLGENIRPDNFGFGETAFQIFILMATRRLQADRFYTTNYNRETYTQLGLDWVDQASFKKVILRHYPELKPYLKGVDNAFNPWEKAIKI